MNKTTKDDFFSPLQEESSKSSDEFFAPLQTENLPWFTKRLENAFAKNAIGEIKSLIQTHGPALVRDYLSKKEEGVQEGLQEFFPTGESFPEGVAGRLGKTAPYAIGGPGTASIGPGRALIGATLGESAKQLGAPEWAQTGLEIAAQGLPTFGKKILPTSAQKDVVDFGRKMGLTEKQITPLIQSEKKQNWLARLVPKGKKTQAILKDTKSSVGEIFGKLRLQPDAQKLFTPEQLNQFTAELEPVFRDLPNYLRDAVRKDLLDIKKDGFTGTSLINFWEDINAIIKSNPGFKKLTTLKDPIAKALRRVSPELEKDFSMTNELYSRYFPIAERLKPTLKSQLLSVGRHLIDLYSVATGNVAFIGERLGERALKEVSRQLLLNPRFQNLSKQVVNSLNSGKYAMATRAAQEFLNELRKEDPEIVDQLDIEDADFRVLHKN